MLCWERNRKKEEVRKEKGEKKRGKIIFWSKNGCSGSYHGILGLTIMKPSHKCLFSPNPRDEEVWSTKAS